MGRAQGASGASSDAFGAVLGARRGDGEHRGADSVEEASLSCLFDRRSARFGDAEVLVRGDLALLVLDGVAYACADSGGVRTHPFDSGAHGRRARRLSLVLYQEAAKRGVVVKGANRRVLREMAQRFGVGYADQL